MEFVRGCREPLGLALAARALLAVLAVTCVPTAAHAAQPEGPGATGEPASAEVKTLMRQGLAALEAGDPEGARDAFRQAWAQKQHFAIAISLAEVEMQLGRYRAAADYFAYYLEHLPEALDEQRANAEEQLAECRRHLGRLRIVAPAGSEVSVNGEVVGRAPLTRDVWVSPGEHQVSMRDADGNETNQAVVVGAAKIQQVELTAPAEPSAPEAPAPKTPVSTRPTPAQDASSDVPAPSADGRIWVLVSGGALTLTAAGIGIGYSVRTASVDDEIETLQREVDRQGDPSLVEENRACVPDDRPAACAALQQRIEQRDRAADTARLAFYVAGGLAVVTTATYLLWPTSDSPETAGRHKAVVTPWLAADGAGLTVFAEF